MQTAAILSFLALLIIQPSFSQQHVVTIKGKILDKETKTPIEYASVTVKNSPIGVISNSQGEFEFHIPEKYLTDSLFVSMLGYESYRKVINSIGSDITVLLTQKAIFLREIVIDAKNMDAQQIIKKAITNIPINYPSKPYMMEGFFRQVQQIDNKYVSVLEAAVNIFDPGYNSKKQEKIDIVEIRRSHYLNTKKYLNIADTFYTQKHNSLKSTLTFNTVRAIASSKTLPETFYQGKYDYQLDSILYFNGRTVYVISANQKLNKGYLEDPEKENRINTILVDAETLAIIKVVFQYSAKSNYEPKEFRNVTKTNDSIQSIVSGHTHIYEFSNYNGFMYLKYVKWSDWVQDYNFKLKKISHLNEYRHELLVNKVMTEPIQFSEVKETTKAGVSLHLQVKDYNEAFWKKYNVIHESSLEKKLINDLMKEINLEKQSNIK